MSSKLVNDYLVMKQLRDDLEFSEECLAIVKAENWKISTIITSMNSEINKKDYTISTDSIDQIKNQFKSIGKISQNATIELMTKESVKENAEKKKSTEMTNMDSRQINQKMGKEFEDDAQFQ